jgi:hypothetical protein
MLCRCLPYKLWLCCVCWVDEDLRHCHVVQPVACLPCPPATLSFPPPLPPGAMFMCAPRPPHGIMLCPTPSPLPTSAVCSPTLIALFTPGTPPITTPAPLSSVGKLVCPPPSPLPVGVGGSTQ